VEKEKLTLGTGICFDFMKHAKIPYYVLRNVLGNVPENCYHGSLAGEAPAVCGQQNEG
jgi:hypothetical protein